MNFLRISITTILTGLLSSPAYTFCGFYVAKADTKLYNEASQVVVVRHEDKTVLSMMNDFKGDLKEFALVVPVPQVLKKEQIHIGDKAVFEHLDAYSAPRLVEYFDEDPCNFHSASLAARSMQTMESASAPSAARTKSLGVTIESKFTVGEYDIVILSAKQSDGLETWLIESGYKIPAGARTALHPYIKQDLKFFVAKVNITEQAKTGVTYLRPIQFAFESPKFMLPIRLGMINAKGPQDLVIYMLTQNGRVETTNYRTVKLPTGMDLPVSVKDDFGSFYKSMFDQQVKKEDMRVVFTEYFWNMGWCDPCAADPLSQEELRSLGVFWLDDQNQEIGRAITLPGRRMPPVWRGGGAIPVMLTRLHVRYNREHFPEDLVFQETKDQENFQGRYVIRHAWKGSETQCPAAKDYFKSLTQRQEKEAQNLASLTGWEISTIRKKMSLKEEPKPWWDNLWK